MATYSAVDALIGVKETSRSAFTRVLSLLVTIHMIPLQLGPAVACSGCAVLATGTLFKGPALLLLFPPILGIFIVLGFDCVGIAGFGNATFAGCDAKVVLSILTRGGLTGFEGCVGPLVAAAAA